MNAILTAFMLSIYWGGAGFDSSNRNPDAVQPIHARNGVHNLSEALVLAETEQPAVRSDLQPNTTGQQTIVVEVRESNPMADQSQDKGSDSRGLAQNIFPVLVLAEPELTPCSSRQENPAMNGEARNGTTTKVACVERNNEFRGGGNTLEKEGDVKCRAKYGLIPTAENMSSRLTGLHSSRTVFVQSAAVRPPYSDSLFCYPLKGASWSESCLWDVWASSERARHEIVP